MSDITNRLVQTFNYETDNLINDIEKNIEQSRETMKNFEEKMKVVDEERWSQLMLKVK